MKSFLSFTGRAYGYGLPPCFALTPSPRGSRSQNCWLFHHQTALFQRLQMPLNPAKNMFPADRTKSLSLSDAVRRRVHQVHPGQDLVDTIKVAHKIIQLVLLSLSTATSYCFQGSTPLPPKIFMTYPEETSARLPMVIRPSTVLMSMPNLDGP